jgi:hypothetical protein
MPDFSSIERLLQSKFKKGESFLLGKDAYTIIESGKPKPSSGECKTDLYILTQNNNSQKEFKISIKLSNHEFLENKTNSERAEEILGAKWSNIISKSTLSIKSLFPKNELIIYSKKNKSYTMKLGWKFEIFNNTNRELKVSPNLTHQQKIEVLSGENLPIDKKNAQVNGIKKTNSGIADHILEVKDENQILNSDLNSIINLIVPISNYAKKMSNMNFGFTALNYRSDKDKWDGNRPLAVWVDWQLRNNKLYGEIKFNKPLVKKGNEIGDNLRKILESLKIKKNIIECNELLTSIDTNLTVHKTN